MIFQCLKLDVPVSADCPKCGQMWVRDHGPLRPDCPRCGHKKPHVTEVKLEWCVAKVVLQDDGSWRAFFNYRLQGSSFTCCTVSEGVDYNDALENAILSARESVNHNEADKSKTAEGE